MHPIQELQLKLLKAILPILYPKFTSEYWIHAEWSEYYGPAGILILIISITLTCMSRFYFLLN